MIDNKYTARTYERIAKEVSFHNNVILGCYGCTERALLTFLDLDKMAYHYTSFINWIRHYILSNTNPMGVIDFNNLNEKRFIDFCNMNVKLDKSGSVSSEHVYKSILSSYTNNSQCSVSGSIIKPCWYRHCCFLKSERPCNIKFNHNTDKEKIEYVCSNSEFNLTILDIKNSLANYIFSYYKSNDSEFYFKTLCLNTFDELELLLLIEDYILSGFSYWNYERIAVYGGVI